MDDEGDEISRLFVERFVERMKEWMGKSDGNRKSQSLLESSEPEEFEIIARYITKLLVCQQQVQLQLRHPSEKQKTLSEQDRERLFSILALCLKYRWKRLSEKQKKEQDSNDAGGQGFSSHSMIYPLFDEMLSEDIFFLLCDQVKKTLFLQLPLKNLPSPTAFRHSTSSLPSSQPLPSSPPFPSQNQPLMLHDGLKALLHQNVLAESLFYLSTQCNPEQAIKLLCDLVSQNPPSFAPPGAHRQTPPSSTPPSSSRRLLFNLDDPDNLTPLNPNSFFLMENILLDFHHLLILLNSISPSRLLAHSASHLRSSSLSRVKSTTKRGGKQQRFFFTKLSEGLSSSIWNSIRHHSPQFFKLHSCFPEPADSRPESPHSSPSPSPPSSDVDEPDSQPLPSLTDEDREELRWEESRVVFGRVAGKLFDSFNSFIGGSKGHRYAIWPLLSSLMLLCPRSSPDLGPSSLTSFVSALRKVSKSSFSPSPMAPGTSSSGLSDMDPFLIQLNDKDLGFLSSLHCLANILEASSILGSSISLMAGSDQLVTNSFRTNLLSKLFTVPSSSIWEDAFELNPKISREIQRILVASLKLELLDSKSEIFLDGSDEDDILFLFKHKKSPFLASFGSETPVPLKRVLIKAMLEFTSSSRISWDVSHILIENASSLLHNTLLYLKDIIDPSPKAVTQVVELLKDILLFFQPNALPSCLQGRHKTTDFFWDIASAALFGYLDVELTSLAFDVMTVFHSFEAIPSWTSHSHHKILPRFFQVNSSIIDKFCHSCTLGNPNLRGESLSLQILEFFTGIWFPARIQIILDYTSHKSHTERSQHSQKPLDKEVIVKYFQGNWTSIETFLLLQLTSNHESVVSTALQCFGLLGKEIELCGGLDLKFKSSFPHNVKLFQQLSEIPCPGHHSTGGVAQQLRIRKELRKVKVATPGNLDAWKEAYLRWSSTLPMVSSLTGVDDSGAFIRPAPVTPSLSQDINQEWIKLTGFLLSLSGICLAPTFSVVIPMSPSPVLSSKRRQTVSKSEKRVTVTGFFGDLLDLSMSRTIQDHQKTNFARDTIHSLLGSCSSPSTFPILFNLMEERISSLFQGEEIEVSGKTTICISVCCNLLRKIVELGGRELLTCISHGEHAGNTMVIEALVEHIVLYNSQLVPNEYHLLSKRSACILLRSIMSKRRYICFSDITEFRNRMIERMMAWNSEFSQGKAEEQSRPATGAPETPIPGDLVKMEMLLAEVDFESLKAISSLLEELPLASKDQELKTIRFSKYFKFFSHILERCKNEDTKNKGVESIEMITITCLSNLFSANIDCRLRYFIAMGYHENVRIRASFLLVIANILQKGTSSALIASRDTEANYQVFIDQLLPLGGGKRPLQSMKILLSLLDVLPQAQLQNLLNSILLLLEAREMTLPLLQTVTIREVSGTQDAPTLFRRNSVFSALLAAYIKSIGGEYLIKLISPLLSKMTSMLRRRRRTRRTHFQADHISFEIDPNKVDEKPVLGANLENLKRACSYFLDLVEASISYCPPQLRQVGRILKESVKQRFPEKGLIAIGSFLFLRMINPAVVAPEAYGIVVPTVSPLTESPFLARQRKVAGLFDVGQITPQIKRGLVLVSKTLQNLANGSPFDSRKEEYMTPMNDFLSSNAERMTTFLLEFVKVEDPDLSLSIKQAANEAMASLFPLEEETTKGSPHPIDYRQSSLTHRWEIGLLHYHLHTHLDAVGEILRLDDVEPDDSESDSDPEDSGTNAMTNFMNLSFLMQSLGPPPDPSSFPSRNLHPHRFGVGISTQNLQVPTAESSLTLSAEVSQSDNSRYLSFMTSHRFDDLSSITEKMFFFPQGSDPRGSPFVFLISRRFLRDSHSHEMRTVFFHILSLLSNLGTEDYVLVVDSTDFSDDNGIGLNWISYLLDRFPTGNELPLLKKLIILHPNTPFYKFSKKVAKIIGPRKLIEKVVHLKLRQFLDHFPEGELGLPPETLHLEKDPKASFKVMVRHKEVTLRVGETYIQIEALKPSKPLFGKPALLVDIIPIALVELATVSSEGSFTLRYRVKGTTRASLSFKCSSSTHVVQSINSFKHIHNVICNESSSSSGRVLNDPGDVPGTLLSMSLFSLTSNNEALRLAAYNMLASLFHAFDFEMKMEVLGTEGLSIPSNSFRFALSLSDKLAGMHPELTLEFLNECVQILNRLSISSDDEALATARAKHLCLEYMKPWLPNLSKCIRKPRSPSDIGFSEDKVSKLKSFLKGLVEFTANTAAETALVLTSAWGMIARLQEDIVEMCFDVCLEHALKKKEDCSACGSILAAMAGFQKLSQLVPSILIDSFLTTLYETADPPVERLDQHHSWEKLTVLLQFLFSMSFNNQIGVEVFLPEIFFGVVALLSTGCIETATTLHAFLVNSIHSLYVVMANESMTLKNLSFHLEQLSQPSFKLLFGLTSQRSSGKVNTDNFLSSVEILTAKLYEILSAVSPQSGSSTHRKWLKLTWRATFEPNTALQPRMAASFGILCRSRRPDFEYNLPNLVQKVIVTLQSALKDFTADQEDVDFAVGLVTSLKRAASQMKAKDPHFRDLFWIGVSLLQVCHPSLQLASLLLLEAVLETSIHDLTKSGNTFETYFLDAPCLRDSADSSKVLKKLDNFTGLSFESNFGFALVGHLLKGIQHPLLKEPTVRFLGSLLRNSTPKSSFVVPYSLGLLMAGESPDSHISSLSSSHSTPQLQAPHVFAFDLLDICETPKLQILSFALIVSLLLRSEKESHLLFLFGLLIAGMKVAPESLFVVFEYLEPHICDIFAKSQSSDLVDIASDLVQQMRTFVRHQKIAVDINLEKLGFQNLVTQSVTLKMSHELQREVAKLVILLCECQERDHKRP